MHAGVPYTPAYLPCFPSPFVCCSHCVVVCFFVSSCLAVGLSSHWVTMVSDGDTTARSPRWAVVVRTTGFGLEKFRFLWSCDYGTRNFSSHCSEPTSLPFAHDHHDAGCQVKKRDHIRRVGVNANGVQGAPNSFTLFTLFTNYSNYY